MTTWQPPIPAGALYSKPARQLGPALALLAYCYDLVQTDGWLDLVLKEAAGDMDTDYRTMRRWWKDVSGGPFFREVIDRGRHGYRVRFKDGWLDWRILQGRKPKEFDQAANAPDEQPSRPDEGPLMTLEELEGQMKAVSRPNEGSTMTSQKTAYKEDIHDHKTHDSRASRAPPSGDHSRLMAAYQEVLGYKIPNGPKEALAAKKILAAGYTVEQVSDVYQTLKAGYWADKHLSLHKVYEELGAVLNAPKAYSNGTHQNSRHANAPSSQPGYEYKRLDNLDE
jgi:hypothetical protein